MKPASEQSAYDLVIIGAGEAGQAAAHLARRLGGTVAIIDRELFGLIPGAVAYLVRDTSQRNGTNLTFSGTGGRGLEQFSGIAAAIIGWLALARSCGVRCMRPARRPSGLLAPLTARPAPPTWRLSASVVARSRF